MIGEYHRYLIPVLGPSACLITCICDPSRENILHLPSCLVLVVVVVVEAYAWLTNFGLKVPSRRSSQMRVVSLVAKVCYTKGHAGEMEDGSLSKYQYNTHRVTKAHILAKPNGVTQLIREEQLPRSSSISHFRPQSRQDYPLNLSI